jgi:hypothetical protein
MAIKTITVLDPTAKSQKVLKMAPRPDSLKGKVVGFVWNNKPGGDILLNRFAELLNERFKFARVVKYTRPLASSGTDVGTLDSLSATCDLIIIAVGDCGSCTSYVVYGAVEFEKRGTPTVSAISIEFESLGKVEAQALGMADLPMVIVPHPVGGIPLEQVAKKADDALEAMIKALSGPVGK